MSLQQWAKVQEVLRLSGLAGEVAANEQATLPHGRASSRDFSVVTVGHGAHRPERRPPVAGNAVPRASDATSCWLCRPTVSMTTLG